MRTQFSVDFLLAGAGEAERGTRTGLKLNLDCGRDVVCKRSVPVFRRFKVIFGINIEGKYENSVYFRNEVFTSSIDNNRLRTREYVN